MATRIFTFPIISILLLLLCLCLWLHPFSLAQPGPPSLLWNICSTATSQLNTPYNVNLDALLDSLHLNSSSSLYHSSSTGRTSLDTVYGMFQCRGDLTLLKCSQCVSDAINASGQRCYGAITARIDMDMCSLIYQNETIKADNDLIFYMWNVKNSTDSNFLSNRNNVLATVFTTAPSAEGYYANYDSGGVYALAQCNGYVSQSDCRGCLCQVFGVSNTLGDQIGGRLYYGTCYYRFEEYLFYATPAPTPSPTTNETPAPTSSCNERDSCPAPSPATNSHTGERDNKPILIGTIVGSSLFVLVLCTFLRVWKRMKRPKSGRNETGAASALRRQQSLELQPDLHHHIRLFSLKQLEIATRNFHGENKLGEGGFGSVYKGILEDGQCVAIKKLSIPSHRGERQFLSEVKLITTVQHRNLITLLGCCVEGSERLLVYEYISNQILDKHIFEEHGSTPLNWSTRRDIIVGIAKGLAYLHEESQVPIVHRDIKAANILLDDKFHPIIADFGLARIFDIDQTHVINASGVAGTLGYLAPEYAMRGQLSEKVDIFSYGVLVLEILSGLSNIDNRLQHGLLHWTWRLYEEQRQLELMDPRLRDNYSVEEAIRLVHVALLCTQGVARLRPAMSNVVMHLKGESEILKIPTSPPFVTSSINKVGLESANDDYHHVRTAPLHVPPISEPPSSSGSDSTYLYAPLMARKYTSSASISDVPEPR